MWKTTWCGKQCGKQHGVVNCVSKLCIYMCAHLQAVNVSTSSLTHLKSSLKTIKFYSAV